MIWLIETHVTWTVKAICGWVNPGLWDACNNVGLRSHYVASVFAARLMSPRRQGLIVTISSWDSLSYLFGVPYGVGKVACDRLAVDMAIDLKSYGVTSLFIWPGIVGTEKVQDLVREVRAMPHAAATVNTPFWQGFNWQTPFLAGRVMAALAADPTIRRRTGQFHIVAELAERYRVVDVNGKRPVSVRSLRFILPVAVSALRRHTQRVLSLKVPWWLLHLFLNLFKNTKRWEIERAKWNIPQP